MSILVKNILRFALLILVQFYVLDKVHLHYMVTPYIYYLFVLWMPFRMPRSWQMVVAFLVGFTLDSFRHSPGWFRRCGGLGTKKSKGIARSRP